jgi:hypothetical protein
MNPGIASFYLRCPHPFSMRTSGLLLYRPPRPAASSATSARKARRRRWVCGPQRQRRAALEPNVALRVAGADARPRYFEISRSLAASLFAAGILGSLASGQHLSTWRAIQRKCHIVSNIRAGLHINSRRRAAASRRSVLRSMAATRDDIGGVGQRSLFPVSQTGGRQGNDGRSKSSGHPI